MTDRTTWSRWDQWFLEALLYVLPALVALTVGKRLTDAVRGGPLEVTGPLPDALTRPTDEVSGPLVGSVVVTDPVVRDYAIDLLPLLVLLVLALLASRLLLGIVRTLREGDPFIASNARRVRSLAVLVLLGSVLLNLLQSVAQDALLAAALPGVERDSVLELSDGPAAVASLLLFFLAEVFSRGARLREDVEGLV